MNIKRLFLEVKNFLEGSSQVGSKGKHMFLTFALSKLGEITMQRTKLV